MDEQQNENNEIEDGAFEDSHVEPGSNQHEQIEQNLHKQKEKKSIEYGRFELILI